MTAEEIADIRQESLQDLTESNLKTLVAIECLTHGYNAILGGDKLGMWLKEHIEGVGDVFGCDDRVYIRMKSKELSLALASLVVKEHIGDEVRWVKCNDKEHWWLYIWWD